MSPAVAAVTGAGFVAFRRDIKCPGGSRTGEDIKGLLFINIQGVHAVKVVCSFLEVVELLAEGDASSQRDLVDSLGLGQVVDRKIIGIRIFIDSKNTVGITEIGRAQEINRTNTDVIGEFPRRAVAELVSNREEVRIERGAAQNPLGETGQQLVCPLLVTKPGVGHGTKKREAVSNASMVG